MMQKTAKACSVLPFSLLLCLIVTTGATIAESDLPGPLVKLPAQRAGLLKQP